jgi:hypothetical protein
MGRLAKFWFLTRHEKQYLCEAGILLSLSHTCVKAMAFKHIDRFLRTHWTDTIQDGERIALEEPVSEPIHCGVHNASPPWSSGGHVGGRAVFRYFLT